MDRIYIVRILMNRLPILLIISISAALITGTLTYFGPRKYKSTAQLATGFTISNKYNLTEERFSLVQADLKFNNLIEIMNSTILIGTLSNHLLLHELTEEGSFSNYNDKSDPDWPSTVYGISKDTLIEKLTKKIAQFELLSSFDSTEKKVVQIIFDHNFAPLQLRKSLSVRRMNYTDYLTVQFESQNPFYSAFVANTLSEEFIRYNNILRFSQSSESIKFLSDLADQKRDYLETKSNSLRSYKSRNQFLNYDLESESKMAQVEKAEEDRIETLNNISRINHSIESLDKKLTDQMPVGNNSSNDMITLRRRLTELIEKRRNQSNNYEILSDSIHALRARVDNIVTHSSLVSQSMLDERESLNVELKVDEEKLNSINDRLLQFQNEMSSIVTTEATISALQREMDIAGQEYLEVQKRLNIVRNANYNSKDDIKIMVNGQPAIKHESSGILLKVILSFISSLVVCIGIILLIEFFDPRLKTASRFNQALDMNLLGTIVDHQPVTGMKRLFNKSLNSDQVLHSIDPSLNKLRFKILSQEGKIILLTSLKEDEGKSFITYSLANALGLIRKKVLIIDTNFRDNQFFKELMNSEIEKVSIEKKLFAGHLKKSSSTVQTDPFVLFEDYLAMPVENKNVHIWQNKNPKGSPAEMLSNWDFPKMMNDLIASQQYDYILLEGASLNDYSDSLELSSFVDKIIMVMDAGTGLSQHDQQTLSQVNGFNGKLMGGILNKTASEFWSYNS